MNISNLHLFFPTLEFTLILSYSQENTKEMFTNLASIYINIYSI